MRSVLPPIPDIARLTQGQPLHLSYMIKNEPFEKLHLSYKPVQKLDHYPPRLSFGFAIPEELAQFRQAAIENNLGDPEELRTTKSLFRLQTLVMSFINGRCGLSPEEDVDCSHVYSLEAALVLELKSNYRQRVPKKKMNEAIRVIKEVFQLPDDAKPKWYLEGDMDLKDPDGYLLPSKLPFSTTTRGKI